jgi:hypothetical protein
VKHMSLKLVLVTALALATSGPLTGADSTATSGSGPTFKHLGPLAFGPDGVLFAADSQDVSITALQLAKQMAGGTAGTKDVPAINQKIAALLGTDAKNLLITDMVVNPKTGNTFISALRGLGANATPVLLRVDGAAKIDLIAFDQVRYTRIGLPNAPPAETPLVLGERKIPVAN